jgi:DNA-directed RNA polymerase specialized sigma24 family protein
MNKKNILTEIEKQNIVSTSKTLSEPFASILILYYGENLSQLEIANRLGLSAFKARHFLSRGLYLLKKETGDKDILKAIEFLYSKQAEI